MDSYVRTPWEMFRYILRWLSAAVISGWSQIGWGSATTRGGVKVHHPPVTYSQPCWFLLCFSLLWRREWSFRDKAWVVRHRAGVKWSFRGKKKRQKDEFWLFSFCIDSLIFFICLHVLVGSGFSVLFCIYVLMMHLIYIYEFSAVLLNIVFSSDV